MDSRWSLTPEQLLESWSNIECSCDDDVGYLCELCCDKEVIRDLIKERDTLKAELEKHKPIKINPKDESTWPPVREWFLDYDAGCWEDDFFEDEEDRKQQISKYSYWMPMPPAPEDE